MRELTWQTAAGAQFPLSSDTVMVLHGGSGFGSPPIEWFDDAPPSGDGTRLRTVRYGAREVTVPLLVHGDTTAELAKWASRFDPRAGSGFLLSNDRRLPCRFIGGIESAEERSRGFREVAGVFRAFDPFWEDVDPDVSVAQVDAIAFLSSDSQEPWFPWQTVEVDVQGGFTVNNDGDDAAFPVWTVQGPGGPVTLVNITTGQTLEIDTVLSAGQQVRIDTRPDVKTVVGPAGVNLWPQVTDPSTLWPIVRGSQLVNVQIVDAVPGETQVRLEWRRRWLSA